MLNRQDRSGLLKKQPEKFFGRFLGAFTVFFMLIFIYKTIASLVDHQFASYYLLLRGARAVFAIYFIIAAMFVFIWYEWRKNGYTIHMKTWQIALIIFCIAVLPRFAVAVTRNYIPTSDFLHYYEMMKLFQGGKDYTVAKEAMESYGYYGYFVLGIFNGLLGSLFGTDFPGPQLAFSVIASVSCVMIFLIGNTYNRMTGIIAGLLFAIYPANIIMSQVTNNQNPGVMFALISIYIVICATRAKKLWQNILLGVLSGGSLLMSHYCHPSSTTTRVAIAAYIIVLAVTYLKDKKRLISLASVLLAFIIALVGADKLTYLVLNGTGFYSVDNADDVEPLYISKIAVGLNPDTKGMYNPDIYGIAEDIDRDEATNEYIDMIKDYVSNPVELCRTILNKFETMWGTVETSFSWIRGGTEEILLKEVKHGVKSTSASTQYADFTTFARCLAFTDIVFTGMLYVFAVFGIFLYKRKSGGTMQLVMWCLLGWIGVHIFIEVQPRYRYFGITMVVILAAAGITALLERAQRYFPALHKAKELVGFSPCKSTGEAPDAQITDTDDSDKEAGSDE